LANAVALGRNDRRFAGRAERQDDALIGIEGLVGVRFDSGLSLHWPAIGNLGPDQTSGTAA